MKEHNEEQGKYIKKKKALEKRASEVADWEIHVKAIEENH